jgi:hypothetical protein
VNDLDFDELDKAIGGAGGDTPPADGDAVPAGADPVVLADDAVAPAEPAVTDDPASAASGGDTTLADVETMAAMNLPADDATPEPESEPSEDAATDGQAIARSQGKFMDMVHSSSDMTVERPTAVPPVAAPSETISREAPDLAPVDETEAPAPEAESAAPDTVEDASAPVTTDESPEAALSDSIGSIDFSASEPADQPTEDALATDAPAEDVASEDADQMNSPFIPDAQVDKRPLGGAPSPEDTIDSTESTPADAPAPVVAPAADQPQPAFVPGGTAPAVAAVGGAPKKGKGGLIWILVIVAAVALLAVGGALVYSFLLK